MIAWGPHYLLLHLIAHLASGLNRLYAVFAVFHCDLPDLDPDLDLGMAGLDNLCGVNVLFIQDLEAVL